MKRQRIFNSARCEASLNSLPYLSEALTDLRSGLLIAFKQALQNIEGIQAVAVRADIDRFLSSGAYLAAAYQEEKEAKKLCGQASTVLGSYLFSSPYLGRSY